MISTFRSIIRNVNSVYLVSTRGLKSDLHIKWVRPEKIACWDPKKSGDLVPLEPLDMTKVPLEYQESEELKTYVTTLNMISLKLPNSTWFFFSKLFCSRANEYVRKVFSCAFMGRRFATQRARKELIDKVKSNHLDFTSCEVQSMLMLLTTNYF